MPKVDPPNYVDALERAAYNRAYNIGRAGKPQPNSRMWPQATARGYWDGMGDKLDAIKQGKL